MEWPQRGTPPPGRAAGAADASQARLVSLVRASQLINSTLVLEDVLERVLDALIEVTGAERGFLVLKEGPQGELQVRVARGVDRSSLDQPSFQVSHNTLRQVVETGRPLHVTDALSDPNFSRFASVTDLQLRSIMAAPLTLRDRTIGAVYVDSRLKAGVFHEGDLELMAAFASQAASAIENARLYEDLQGRMREVAGLRDYQENVLRSAASGIVTIDPAGRVTVFNRAAESIFGVPAVGALGKPYHEVLGIQITTKLLTRMARVMGSGERVSDFEYDGSINGRQRAVLRISLSPLHSSVEGRAQGLVLVADDLTDARIADEGRAREAAEKEAVRSLFGHYVAPSVVDHLIEMSGQGQLQLGGDRKQVSILFADIRGFTSIAETLKPEDVVKLLNRYLGVATQAIIKDDGTLDKYMGDAVMAFFNAPLPQHDHVLRAVRAAAAMQHAVHAAQQPGGPVVGFGVGVNTGDAIVGNIGTEQLMNYTVVGDAVNVAARLQSVARAGEVLLSGATYEHVKEHIDAETLPPIEVKGRRQPVAVYRLRSVR